MPNHHLLNGLFSHRGREKYPPTALNWVFAVLNFIHTYIHTYIASVSELLCLTPILVSEDFEGSSVATLCLPWERHCFKDGSYDCYQSTTVVAPLPAEIAPKFKALGKAWEFPPGKSKAPLCSIPTPEGWKAELALTDFDPPPHKSFD